MTKQWPLIVGFLAAFAAAGVYLGQFVVTNTQLRIGLLIPCVLFTVLAFVWCRNDAREGTKMFTAWQKLLVIFVAPFGFLAYVVFSYPFPQAMRIALAGFLVAASCGVAFIGSIAMLEQFDI